MSERSLGDEWAATKRARGAWVQKLPSSALAGLPDWCHVMPGEGIALIEAKLLQPKGSAFVPSQATRAQRFFLSAVSRFGGEARILILGPESFLEWPVPGEVRPCSRDTFDKLAEPYMGAA